MLQEFNAFLTDHTSPERRGLLLDTARTLEIILGPEIWISIDPVIYRDDVDNYERLDTIDEILLGLLTNAYSRFGVALDIEQIQAEHFYELTDGLETILQIEVNENADGLLNIFEIASDTSEALILVLEEISPSTGLRLENLIEHVKPSLLSKLKEILREVRISDVPEVLQLDGYVERVKAYREKYEFPPLIAELREKNANLFMSPDFTISLISSGLVDLPPKDAAREIYALTLLSTTPGDSILVKAKELATKAFADEIKAGLVERELSVGVI